MFVLILQKKQIPQKRDAFPKNFYLKAKELWIFVNYLC